MEIWIDTLIQAIQITGFVMAMMLIVEYLTIQSRGQWAKTFERSSWLQVLLAAFLGVTPGCLGGFAVVTLYTHRVIQFPALVAAMVAASGDEAFVMFSMIPGQALQIHLYLIIIAIVSGLILSLWLGRKTMLEAQSIHKQFHANEPQCICFEKRSILPQLKNISLLRASFLLVGFAFLALVIFGHHHEAEAAGSHWEKYFFAILIGIYLFIIATAPNHFIDEHLWAHTIKKHFPKIFLWTFGAFLFIHLMDHFLDINHWVKANPGLILLLALLIGLIPESGPHIIFISLFAQGLLPMSVLLANSIVQDGHSTLPLLAESKRSFVWVKIANFAIGAIVGGGMMWLGY